MNTTEITSEAGTTEASSEGTAEVISKITTSEITSQGITSRTTGFTTTELTSKFMDEQSIVRTTEGNISGIDRKTSVYHPHFSICKNRTIYRVSYFGNYYKRNNRIIYYRKYN